MLTSRVLTVQPDRFQCKTTAVDFESAFPPDNRRFMIGSTDATFVSSDLRQLYEPPCVMMKILRRPGRMVNPVAR